MANYSLVVGNSFSPFTFQEMLTPYATYKQEYENMEQNYEAIQDKADKFKYLSENLPEDSKARQIYEGYANDLNSMADDVLKRGLNMSNRRGLMSLKRRYAGEIGRLEQADAAMQKEVDLRRQLNAKDGSLLYATDNLSIDNFLDKQTPNLYSISGNELYARGAQAGKSISSRVFSAGDAGSTVAGYYRDWVEKMGYSPESLAAFRENMDSIPEFRAAIDGVLAERGVNENLTGVSRQRARQAVINGVLDGAVYQESHKPVRDPGKLSTYEAENLQLAKDKFNYDKKQAEKQENFIYHYDSEGNITGYNPAYLDYLSAKAAAKRGDKEGIKKDTIGDISQDVKKTDLQSDDGFYTGSGKNKKHYSYIGIINGDKEWGKIGDSNGAWGIFGTDDMENAWGNFSMENNDTNRRMLPKDDQRDLINSDQKILRNVKEMLVKGNYIDEKALVQTVKKQGGSENDAEQYINAIVKELVDKGYIEIIEGNNQFPKGDKRNYAIAVSQDLTPNE